MNFSSPDIVKSRYFLFIPNTIRIDILVALEKDL